MKGKGGKGEVVDRGKVLKNRQEKKKKGSWGGGTTQHTKFIMFMFYFIFMFPLCTRRVT